MRAFGPVRKLPSEEVVRNSKSLEQKGLRLLKGVPATLFKITTGPPDFNIELAEITNAYYKARTPHHTFSSAFETL